MPTVSERRERLHQMGDAADWEAERIKTCFPAWLRTHAAPEFLWSAVIEYLNLKRFAAWARSV
jgi:hypothetical protein